MFRKICLLLAIVFIPFVVLGCSHTETTGQKQSSSPALVQKGLAKRFPSKIPQFTLQSATANKENMEAQALYLPVKNEHIYSIVVIKELSSSSEAEHEIKKTMSQHGRPTDLTINSVSAWSTFTDKPNMTCYLGAAKDCFTIEIDTHSTMGYKADKDQLMILSHNLAKEILDRWQ